MLIEESFFTCFYTLMDPVYKRRDLKPAKAVNHKTCVSLNTNNAVYHPSCGV